MNIVRAYLTLTKTGIIIFALVSALAGYAVSYRLGQDFDPMHPILLLIGLYLVAGGGFALNQAQEWRIDSRMPRTQKRPIPAGVFTPFQGYAVGFLMCIFGLLVLLILNTWTAALALLTLVLYNGVYTYVWKRQWAFAAVPGAIPGAMPVVIGYSVNTHEIWRPDCVYLFLIMFLWQMPHFWSLAIRFREDYRAGGIPVLPVRVGVDRSMYHIGLYVFTYVGVALLAPWFLRAHAGFLFLVFPISLKVLWEFYKYFRSQEGKGWLPFFLWTNLSLLVFLAVPVMDKWLYFAL